MKVSKSSGWEVRSLSFSGLRRKGVNRMDILKDALLILYGAIINQLVALVFTKRRRKKSKVKTTLSSPKSKKGGSLDN